MSNPTELPDLDKLEALAQEIDAFPDTLQPFVSMGGQVVIHTFSMTIDQVNKVAALYDALPPAAVLALVAAARRAQPEDEAPQADEVARKELLLALQAALDTCATKSGAPKMSHLGTLAALNTAIDVATRVALAAQHAESGASGMEADLLARDLDAAALAQDDKHLHGLLVRASVGIKAIAAQSQGAQALTPLDYRAQGREEALAIILAQSAEDPFAEYLGWGKSGAPEDEGSSYWKEDELRALLHIGDRTHDAYDRAEGAYWEALGRKDEAARELLFAQQAPFYKPLHDFLSKHEAWDLMADLQRAQQAAAPGALDAYEMTRLRRLIHALGMDGSTNASDDQVRGLLFTALGQAAGKLERAPGTPEAPADLPRLYRFDCYVGKTKMAAGVGVHATSMEEAEQKARKLADKDETIKFESNRPCHASRKCSICAEYERAAQLDGGQEGSESNG